MSVALMLRGLHRTIIVVVCLSLSLVGQQGVQVQAVAAPSDSGTAAQSGSQSKAPLPSSPQPKGAWVNPAKGASYFPNPLSPYLPRIAPPAVLTSQPKLESMIQNGKIMLSMNDAVAMALADNLDIAIARYNLPIADTDLLRTKAGAGTFGAPSGLVADRKSVV